MLIYSPVDPDNPDLYGHYSAELTNATLSAEGCAETTNVAFSDLIEGCVVKYLLVDDNGSYHPSLNSFTNIAQLKALVDANSNTVTETVTNINGTLYAINNTSTPVGLIFNDADNIMYVNYEDPNEPKADYLIVFIESQPE